MFYLLLYTIGQNKYSLTVLYGTDELIMWNSISRTYQSQLVKKRVTRGILMKPLHTSLFFIENRTIKLVALCVVGINQDPCDHTVSRDTRTRNATFFQPTPTNWARDEWNVHYFGWCGGSKRNRLFGALDFEI